MDQVVSWLGEFIDGFDFTRKGTDQSLGRDVALTIIRGPDTSSLGGIMGRCADEITPDGAAWPANSDNPSGKGYASRKERIYGWRETNRRTGQLLSQVSLYGKTTIEPRVVTLVYGTDEPPSNSAAPTGYMSDADESVTDTEKAQYAHIKGRGFYGWAAEDKTNVIAVCQENLDGYIKESG